MKTLYAALVISFLTAPLASAQSDIEGSSDHPLVPRIIGSYIVDYRYSDFDSVTIPTGPNPGSVGSCTSVDEYTSSETVEGEHWRITYRFSNPDISTLRVERSYRQALEEAGFEILYADSERELGYCFVREGALFRPRQLSPAIEMPQPRYISARSKDGSTLVSMLTINTRIPSGNVVLIDVVTQEDMKLEMEVVSLTTSEIEEGLLQDGRVAIQDILFGFNSVEILPESAEPLETIAALMQERADLSLLVVGHTDSVGGFDYNLTLSHGRASSVVDWLSTRHGIDGGRLQAAGAGMMSPVSSNRTEEGRSLNRRVELVELPN